MKKLTFKITIITCLLGLAVFLFFKHQDHFLKNKKDYFPIKSSRAEQLPFNPDQIRMIPYYKNGKPSGFKVLTVESGSFFHELGLKRGDILKTMNGTPFDIKTGSLLFDLLEHKKEFYIEVERQGESKRLEHKIVE